MHTLRPQLPFPGCQQGARTLQGSGPAQGTHPECFFPATSAWQMQNLSEGCFREQGLDWSIP